MIIYTDEKDNEYIAKNNTKAASKKGDSYNKILTCMYLSQHIGNICKMGKDALRSNCRSDIKD